MSCYILGYGANLPEKVITNQELAPKLGVSSEWIETNSGIRERHWVEPNQTTSDLAVLAVKQAIDNAGITPDAVDYLIGGTLSPDYQVPGIAPLVQNKLNGLRNIPAVDLRVGCVNILYSLQLAKGLVEANLANTIVCFGAEAQSKGLNLTPKAAELSMLFGDGAGALVISNKPRLSSYTNAPVLELQDVVIATDGSFAEDLAVKSPGTANGAEWLNSESIEKGLHYGVMNGRVVIMQAVRKLGDIASEILKRNNLSLEEINLIIPHQANINLLRSLAKRLSISENQIVVNLDRYGNTSSASAFLALHQAKEEKRLISGQNILFLAFGAGFTWGAALCKVV